MFCGSFGYVPKILLAYTSETGSLQPWQKIQATWAQLPVMWCHGAAETTGGVMASRNRCSRPHHDCSFFLDQLSLTASIQQQQQQQQSSPIEDGFVVGW